MLKPLNDATHDPVCNEPRIHILCRRPRRGFHSWAKWRSGKDLAAEKKREAQSVMMKMVVKAQEMVEKRPVSETCLRTLVQTVEYITIQIFPLCQARHP